MSHRANSNHSSSSFFFYISSVFSRESLFCPNVHAPRYGPLLALPSHTLRCPCDNHSPIISVSSSLCIFVFMASAMAALTVQLLLLHLLDVVVGCPSRASCHGWFLLPARVPAILPLHRHLRLSQLFACSSCWSIAPNPQVLSSLICACCGCPPVVAVSFVELVYCKFLPLCGALHCSSLCLMLTKRCFIG
jgi:hypothetical protein